MNLNLSQHIAIQFVITEIEKQRQSKKERRQRNHNRLHPQQRVGRLHNIRHVTDDTEHDSDKPGRKRRTGFDYQRLNGIGDAFAADIHRIFAIVDGIGHHNNLQHPEQRGADIQQHPGQRNQRDVVNAAQRHQQQHAAAQHRHDRSTRPQNAPR